MIDLKKIIGQLDNTTYASLEEAFVKSKAENSLYLLKSYRTGSPIDKDIITHLRINPTSLYTLKSRLYDKIQDKLVNFSSLTEEELLNQVNLVHQVCYTNTKEIAVAHLTKLEEQLQANDMHGELLVVYSALKQLHLLSEKYFHYSQLYNKQIAFNLTTEKSNEILGNFNRILMLYDFSKGESDLETLNFLHKGIQEQYSLNASKQIELIKNIIEIELFLFTELKESSTINALELLKRSVVIIEQLPYYKEQKQWIPVINYLYFEYYLKMNDTKNALLYYEKVNSVITSLPFYSNICIVSKFLISKIGFLSKNDHPDLTVFDEDLIDSKNMHFSVNADIYNSVILFYAGKIKEAIAILNNLLNNISVKDLHYINLEIKLTLSYYYIKRKETDMADNILKSVSRKIKSDELLQFFYVNNLIKLFQLELNQSGKQTKDQQGDLLTLFNSKNNMKLLNHLNSELTKQYAS